MLDRVLFIFQFGLQFFDLAVQVDNFVVVLGEVFLGLLSMGLLALVPG